jgi:deoxyribodipyrimidine photo-lyase
MAEKTILFIFRRDLRVHDNTAWDQAQEYARVHRCKVLPIFIFSGKQVRKDRNPYYNGRAGEFMIECLQSLSRDLGQRLQFFYTKDSDLAVLNRFFPDAAAVAFNMDLTPFARARDAEIREWCRDRQIPCIAPEDYTMYTMEQAASLSASGRAFKVFTPFFAAAKKRLTVRKPKAASRIPRGPVPKRIKGSTSLAEMTKKYFPATTTKTATGGRAQALAILSDLAGGKFRSYDATHDIPALDSTTHLGAHLKFGTISCREAYHAFAKNGSAKLLEQIHWRDFYYAFAYAYPASLNGQLGGAHENEFYYGKFRPGHAWSAAQDDVFEKWKGGRTGVPLVDAAMRCLAATGWLHNRLRMVVAMYLVRDQNVDWRKGERYFAQVLTDYDAINNNMGWVWALTYRHTLSPYRQAERFDGDGKFVETWLADADQMKKQ